MQIPQMPKGVEHTAIGSGSANSTQVQIPQMPKGVEHAWFVMAVVAAVLVQIPQMPKGVEHLAQMCAAFRQVNPCRYLRCRKALSTSALI